MKRIDPSFKYPKKEKRIYSIEYETFQYIIDKEKIRNYPLEWIKMDSFEAMMVALKFNEKINQQDLTGLVKLMTDDHIFIDNFGDVDNNMIEGWKQFFANYPDYRNIFTSVTVTENVVVMIGYSTCSNEPRLNGPSMWTAKIRDTHVSEWRVYWLDQR